MTCLDAIAAVAAAPAPVPAAACAGSDVDVPAVGGGGAPFATEAATELEMTTDSEAAAPPDGASLLMVTIRAERRHLCHSRRVAVPKMEGRAAARLGYPRARLREGSALDEVGVEHEQEQDSASDRAIIAA